MTWLAWRQFRAQALLATAATIVVTIVLARTREVPSTYDSVQLLGTALVGVPAFVGAFWGAPLLARELEAGTHRLAWTQGVTRARWLATKLGLTGAVSVGLTGAFALAFTWWSQPLDALGNRIGTADFGQRGVVPVAYALFALALGTLLGALVRRTLPAMAGTLAGFFVVRYLFQLFVRPHLLSTVVTTRPTNQFGAELGGSTKGGWVLSSHLVDAGGHAVSPQEVDRLVAQACEATRDSARLDLVGCVRSLGIRDVLRVHPGDQFWALQAVEAAAFVALAAALAAACFWWVRHRAS